MVGIATSWIHFSIQDAEQNSPESLPFPFEIVHSRYGTALGLFHTPPEIIMLEAIIRPELIANPAPLPRGARLGSCVRQVLQILLSIIPLIR